MAKAAWTIAAHGTGALRGRTASISQAGATVSLSLAACCGSGSNQPLGLITALAAGSSITQTSGTVPGTGGGASGGGYIALAAANPVKNFAGSTTELAAVPGSDASLAQVGRATQGCRGCDLYERATQTVFGRGSGRVAVVLIGEQPGDAEDKAGAPFVGPAGKLLDRALAEAGISPEQTYTTNAVKHFRWKPGPRGGKRRIHERPETWQVRACWPWLAAELARLEPRDRDAAYAGLVSDLRAAASALTTAK